MDSSTIRLECDYCGERITEDDYKCPKCGASCSHIVKKYKEQQERDALEAKRIAVENRKKEERKTLPLKIFVIFMAVFIFIMALVIFFRVFQHGKSGLVQNSAGVVEIDQADVKMEVGYQEKADNSSYSVILDEYEFYEYSSDNFPEQYNTPEGYQKIAFRFVYTNKKDTTIHFSNSVSLKADDFKVDESSLKIGMFESVVSGKSKYPEFYGTLVGGKETFQGYVGFLVPKDKKELKFTLKDVTITMNNPCYQE